MPMYDPCHPGEIILDSMEETGLTVRKCAEKLGVERDALAQVLDERSSVSPELASALERIGWGAADLWMRLQNSYDTAPIRMGEEAART